MSDSGNWEANTPPESLSAMRRAIAANTETANAALEWSVKTYELVKPVADGMRGAQREARFAMVGAALAVALSFLGLACELVR